MRIRSLMVGLVLAAFAGVAHAQPVHFDLDGSGSSIDYNPQTGGCGSFFNPQPCISADLAGGLGATAFTLNAVGDSHTFDFAEVLFDDALGGEEGEFDATVAFDSPAGAAASTTGDGQVINLFGLLQLGSLVWLPIADIVMPNGIAFGLELQELAGINLGTTVTVGATVTLLAMAVPSPVPLGMMGLGLLALGVVRHRRA
ncbi:MAG: hypothetical protein AB8B93_19675 [Pseudomonadales bacterium]